MAPERIKGESQNALSTYTVSSDVWSVGLATLEIALGKYPYPPETYLNVFAQLSAIVHGDPPELPDTYSEHARDWVNRCLVKRPEGRASYAELMVCYFAQHPYLVLLTHVTQNHPFLQEDARRNVDIGEWVTYALQWREEQKQQRRSRQQEEQLHPSDTLRPSKFS
jgi:mitogen-activated protein kinase kinase